MCIDATADAVEHLQCGFNVSIGDDLVAQMPCSRIRFGIIVTVEVALFRPCDYDVRPILC